MSYSTRSYARERAAEERARHRAQLVRLVRADIEAQGLGPAVVRPRPSDLATLVLDARGWVHAVISVPRGAGHTYEVARDLRGEAWSPKARSSSAA